jgi:hypothetical protein
MPAIFPSGDPCRGQSPTLARRKEAMPNTPPPRFGQAAKTTLFAAGNEADVRKKRRQATFCQ